MPTTDRPDALAALPRAHSWTGSEGQEFACPLPAYRMVENPEDPGGERITVVETCGYPLTYEVTDGGTFWGDLEHYEVGATWQVGCQGGHVLVMADGVDDVPSEALSYDPAVTLLAVYLVAPPPGLDAIAQHVIETENMIQHDRGLSTDPPSDDPVVVWAGEHLDMRKAQADG